MMTRSLAAAMLAIALPAAAQDVSAPRPDVKHAISTAPLSDAFGSFNLELQRRLTEHFTVGISGGTFDYDWSLFGNADEDDFLATVLVRYYPLDRAFSGFFIGARAGMHRDTTFTYADDGGFLFAGTVTSRVRDSVPAGGIELGYDRIVGHHGYVGIGAGAIRTIARNQRRAEVFPTIRLNVGFVF